MDPSDPQENYRQFNPLGEHENDHLWNRRGQFSSYVEPAQAFSCEFSPLLKKSECAVGPRMEQTYDLLRKAIEKSGLVLRVAEFLGCDLALRISLYAGMLGLPDIGPREEELEASLAEALNTLLNPGNDVDQVKWFPECNGQIDVIAFPKPLRRLTRERKLLHDRAVARKETQRQQEQQVDLSELTMPKALAWIDAKREELDQLHQQFIPGVQEFWDAVAAATEDDRDLFPELKDKRTFAEAIQSLVDQLGATFIEPSGSPARLNAFGKGGTKGGGFRFRVKNEPGVTDRDVGAGPPLPNVVVESLSQESAKATDTSRSKKSS